MAENNNFEEIKESFEYISEALNSMRAQNAMNAGNSDKVLTHIDNQLKELLNEENSDLMKVFMVELKKSLDERHNFVSLKFGEIEDSFKEIINKTKDQLKATEIKELFEIIASNLNTFSTDFSSQKELISELDLKIEELKQDESQKKEILKNISTLKQEVEKVNNGFESVVLHMSTNFKEVAKTLEELDTSQELSSIKKDIENVFLSTSAVISTMQVIDRKNRELEEVINTFVTKEDFNIEQEQVAKLIVQNMELTEYINNLPTQNNFKALTEKFDTSIGVINALKNMLTETGKQNQQMLTAQLDNLETKILNISSEEEFIGFRKELSEFAQEVMQSTNLMRTDIADTNADLKDLLSYLSSLDIKETFANFENLKKTSEENIKKSISDLSGHVSKEVEKNRKVTKSDIDAGVLELNGKISEAKQEMMEGSKLNLSNILEHIQSVVNNIFSVKNAMHIDNLESVEAIDVKIQELKDEIATSNNFIAQTTHENKESIIADINSNVDKVYEELSSAKEDLSSKLSDNSRNLTVSFSEISQKIGEIKEELNQSSQENFTNILSIVEDFSQGITDVKTSMEESSAQNSGEIKDFIEILYEKFNNLKEALTKDSEINTVELRGSMETLATKLNLVKAALTQELKEEVSDIKVSVNELSESFENLKDTLVHDAQANVSELKSLVEDLTQVTASVKASLEQSASIGFAGLKTNIGELAHELSAFEENFDIKTQANLSRIISLFDDFAKDFNSQKEFLSESSQQNFEAVSAYIQNLNKKIDETRVDLSEDLKSGLAEIQNTVVALPETVRESYVALENASRENFDEIQNTIFALPETIKENQNAFVNESRVLLEENSKNITETGDKIQSLIRSLIAKENPLKGEFLQAFGELKTNFETIKEDLTASNQILGENVTEEIKTNIQNFEDLISQYSEKYDYAVIDLQNKLEDKLEMIDQTAQNNSFRLSDSIKETSEIKKEIQSLMESISSLKDDSAFADLTEEMSNKFEGLLLNIRQVEEVSLTKNKEVLHSALNSLEEKFETISGDLKKFQNISSAEKAEFIEELNDKIETVRVQMGLTGTDVIDALSAKEDEILMLLAPIRETVEKIAETDFEETILEIKNKVDSSLSSISLTIKENMDSENEELCQKLSQDFENLNNKFNQVLSRSSLHAIELGNLKEALDEITKQIEKNSMVLVDRLNNDEFLTEQFASVKDIVSEGNVKNAEILNETSETLFEKLDSSEGKILEAQDSTKEEISDKITQLQEELENVILTELQENIRMIKQVLGTVSEKSNTEEIAKKIEEFEISVKSTSEKIETILSASKEDYENSVKNLLYPIKETVQRLAEVDFEEVILEITTKIDSSASSVSSAIKEEIEIENEQQLQKISQSFEEIEDKFTQILSKSSLHSSEFDNLKEALDEIAAQIEKSFVTINSNLNNDEFLTEQFASVKDVVADAKAQNTDAVKEASENVLEKMEELKVFLTPSEDNSQTEEILGKITSLHRDIAALEDKMLDIQEEAKEAVSEKIVLIQESLESLEGKMLECQGETKEAVSDKILLIQESLESLEGKMFEDEEASKEGVSEKIVLIQESLESLESKLLEAQSENTEEISSKIVQLQEEIESSILNELQENIKVIKQVLSSVSEDGNNEEIFGKIKELDVAIKSASEKLDNVLSNTGQDYKESAQALLSEVKTSFYEKVDDSIDDLRSFIEVLENKKDFSADIDDLRADIFDKFSETGYNVDENKKDLIGEIDNFKSEVLEKFSEISTNFEQNISSISIKEDLDDLKTEMESSIQALMDNLSEKISAVVENNTSNDDILNKSEEIARRVEDLKNSVVDDITEKLAIFEINLEKQSKDFSEILEVTKVSLDEIKENFVELSLNSTMEISNFLVTFQEKIESIETKFAEFNLNEEFKGIESKIDGLNLSEKFENIETKLSEINFDSKFDEIKNKVEKIDLIGAVERIEKNFTKFDLSEDSQKELKQEFELINQKLDMFAMESDSEIKENVEEIKQIVQSQNELIKQFNKAPGNDNAISSASNELKKIVEKFEEKLNLLALEDISGGNKNNENKKGEIKKELSSFKEELFENLVEFFNQISFVAEAEEIKDFVEEKTEEIKQYLKSIQTIQPVQTIIRQEPAKEEDDGYSYTLQDVESDIAKVRMALNDIVKSTKAETPTPKTAPAPTGDFDQLNESIMSISSRTNKLLLNSDESYSALKNNLDSLKNIVYQFEEKVKHIDNKAPIERIEKKLENIDKLMVSSVNSDKIFNQTFMYLAEWIDRADEKMSNIEEKVLEIEDVKMSMLKSYDLETLLDKFVKKFDKQEEKIKALETKIEKLSKGKTKAAPETDIKTIVQEVLAKIELSEAKPDDKLVKKMDGIDRRLTTLGKNIEKITSYVE